MRIPENDRQEIADAIEKLREAYSEEVDIISKVAGLEQEAEDLGVDTAYLRKDAGHYDVRVLAAVARMKAWANDHGECDVQGVMDYEWVELARAALGFPPTEGYRE